MKKDNLDHVAQKDANPVLSFTLQIHSPQTVNCETANVIYLISGKVCNKPGVGDTQLPSSNPINLHRSKEHENVTYS
jgi:hypothetical protein